MKPFSQTSLIFTVSLFFALFFNYAFFKNVITVYPFNLSNSGFLISLAIVLVTFTTFFFTLFSSRWTTKPILMISVLISSLTNYFMNTYHVVIDESMIRNTMQTNLHESLDLLSLKQIVYFLFLGLFPAYLIYKTPIVYGSFAQEIWRKIKTLLFTLVVILVSLFAFSKHYTSFFREHIPLRYSVNPLFWIYSTGQYLYNTFHTDTDTMKVIGLDAHISTDTPRKTLMIMVVGEAARADHFSLNGYRKNTNPLLQKENIINFSHMSSCGTSTAVSVPCMFSIYTRDTYSYQKGLHTENVLDVLRHTNQISILWRDNNSDSKGVALRVPYADYKTPQNNTICVEGECRDTGMLVGLDDFIATHKNKHILIVLHQMGNHGPAYYRRYTKAFEIFTPTCKTNQLENCTKEEIVNAYDNAIVYTDYFLAQTIQYLKQYDSRYNTLMLYIADHGESLGEGGLYLHGMPYFIAPDAQTHVASFLWAGKMTLKDMHLSHLQKKGNNPYSQDNIFHTLLGIFNVQTGIYQPDMDILHENQED